MRVCNWLGISRKYRDNGCGLGGCGAGWIVEGFEGLDADSLKKAGTGK